MNNQLTQAEPLIGVGATCDDWCTSSSACISGGSDCLYCGWNFGCKKTIAEDEDNNKEARKEVLKKIRDVLAKDEADLDSASLRLMVEIEEVISY